MSSVELTSPPSFTSHEIELIHSQASKLYPGTQLALAKINNDDISFYGVVKTANALDAIENHSFGFEIGSITKVMTSRLLAEACLSGIIDLEQPIQEVLPFKIKETKPITFRQLATHTSGLPALPNGLVWKALFKDRHNPYQSFDEQALINALATRLKTKENPACAYSNLGVGLLGYTLGKLYGTTFEDLVTRKIFEPLAMTQSGADYQAFKGELVQGLNRKGKPTQNWDLASLKGAGSVTSNCIDMVKFIAASLDPADKISQFQQQVAHENKKDKMGLGWLYVDLSPKSPSRNLLFHNGGTGGFTSSMLLDPENRSGYLCLSNISGLAKFKGGVPDGLTFGMLEALTSARRN